MRNLENHWSLAIWVTAAVLLVSCSKNPAAPKVGVTDPPASPDVYPPIPRPTSTSEVTPDTSESYYAIMPMDGKQIDFAPTWTEGVFTWHIDVQTQRDICGIPDCEWEGYPPGPYYDGTARNTALVFESGQVDLRSPQPFWYATRRLQFVNAGRVLDSPMNPDLHPNQVIFGYTNPGSLSATVVSYPAHTYNAVFGGAWFRDEKPHFLEVGRRAEYQLAALSCPKLTNPVFLRRQRFWQRVPLTGQNDPNGGGTLKSVIVYPGASYSVEYWRVQGVDSTVCDSITRTVSAEVTAKTPKEIAEAKLSESLSDVFSTRVSSHQETQEMQRQTFNGEDQKILVYSVWTTVERYTFVDKNGNPYTDPNFKFEPFGSATILGDFESLVSTSFPYSSTAPSAAAGTSATKLNRKGGPR